MLKRCFARVKPFDFCVFDHIGHLKCVLENGEKDK